MTEREKQTLKWALNQALAIANNAVAIYLEDGETESLKGYQQDVADIWSLIKELT